MTKNKWPAKPTWNPPARQPAPGDGAVCCPQLLAQRGDHNYTPTIASVTAKDLASRPEWYPGATRPGIYQIVDLDPSPANPYARPDPSIRYDLLTACPFCGAEINQ